MGQQHSLKQYKNFSNEEIQKLTQTMLINTNQRFSINDVSLVISLILQNLKSNIPIQMTPTGIVMNTHMVKILYHGQFVQTINKLIFLLIEKLEQMGEKNILLIKRHQWGILSQLVKFILIFTDQKIIQTVQIYTIRLSQLDSNIKVMIEQLQQSKGSFTAIEKKVIDKLSPHIAESMYMVLLTTLLKLIQQRNSPINRSSETLLIIQHVEQSLFMLFNKLVFTPHHYKTFIDKARNTIALKDFLTIGQYFLASSCDLSLPSVYQAAVLLLLCVIQRNQKNLKIIEKDIRGLPSFIFPNLPIINKRSSYDCIVMMCLFGLVYTKEGTNWYQRFTFNRLLTLRLLNVIVREIKVTSGQMTEYIEELSLQTKIGMAERSFVTEVVKNYVKLIDEKIIQNRQQEQIKKSISIMTSTVNAISKLSSKVIRRIKRLPKQHPAEDTFTTISSYTRESNPSQILIDYLKSGAQPYSIKHKGKRYTIPYIDVVDEIEKDDNQLQKQLNPLYEKFVYEFILYKKVIYQHNERYVWSEILPKIIENQGLEGHEIRESQMSEMSEVNSSRINVVGYAPVISLKLSQSQVRNSMSSMSKNKSSSKNSRYETQQQGIYNQTTEQNKSEFLKPQMKLKQWQNTQSQSKFQNIENQTPQSKLNRQDHGENSEMQINMPHVDNILKIHHETQQFVVEHLP